MLHMLDHGVWVTENCVHYMHMCQVLVHVASIVLVSGVVADDCMLQVQAV